MKSIKFDNYNKTLAEDQPEYNRVYAYYGQIGGTPSHTGFVCCFELDDHEIHMVAKERKIWLSQLTFGQRFNPIHLNAMNPFNSSDFAVHQDNLLGKTEVEVKLSFMDRIRLLFSTKPVKVSIKHLGTAGLVQIDNLKQETVKSVFDS